MNNSKATYILYAFIGLYIITSVTVLVRSYQGVDWDPGTCIKMTDNAYKGIPFNAYAHPKPGNLNEDEFEFVTWWSPGQFAVPLLIQKIIGVKVNIAIRILTALCLLIAGLGIFKLFRLFLKNENDEVGNGSSTATIALLLFALLQPFFWKNIFVYNGGGILMLAYCPWFIYWVIKINRITLYSLLLLLLAGFVGFFLKSSFTSIFAGALFYLFLTKSINAGVPVKQQNLKKITVNALCLGAVLLVYILTIKIAYLNHNTGISQSSTGIRVQPRVLLYPVIAPVIGLFSLNFLNKTVYWIIASFFVIPIYYLLFKNNRLSLTYKYVLISFVITTVSFYALLYFINVDVSYELRHYIIISILLTPAFFISLWRLPFGKYLVYGIAGIYIAINVYQLTAIIIANPKYRETNLYSGFPTNYPADLIEKVHALDNLKNHKKDIFYFRSSELTIALEVRNNRVLFEDNFVNFHFNNKARYNSTLYFGRNSGELYLIYPLQNFKQDSISYLTRFEKYKSFEKIYQTKGYAIFKAH
jgi:hypothetical protein